MDWMLMPIRRYAEFSGRSRRKEYWMFVLGVFLLFFVLGILLTVVGGASLMSTTADPSAGAAGMLAGMGLFSLVIGIIWLGLIIPSLAVAVRRLHDTDRTGWWLAAPIGLAVLYGIVLQISPALATIAMLAYVVAAIALLVFMFLDGTKGPNRFGEDPKSAANAESFA